jgi:hypothetical protein
MAAVGREHGLILHAAAKTDDGFLILNLWPSKEASEAAARDPRRLGVIEQAELAPDQVRRSTTTCRSSPSSNVAAHERPQTG